MKESALVILLELSAQIQGLYEVEPWRVGTIARHLHLHGDTV